MTICIMEAYFWVYLILPILFAVIAGTIQHYNNNIKSIEYAKVGLEQQLVGTPTIWAQPKNYK